MKIEEEPERTRVVEDTREMVPLTPDSILRQIEGACRTQFSCRFPAIDIDLRRNGETPRK